MGKIGNSHWFQWESQPLPLVKAATQGTHAVDAHFVQGHGRLGGSSLAWASAIKHDVTVAGNFEVTRGKSVWRYSMCSRQREGIVQQLQRMAQVYDIHILAGIEPFPQFLWLQARGSHFL